jgi:hypothetical protein
MNEFKFHSQHVCPQTPVEVDLGEEPREPHVHAAHSTPPPPRPSGHAVFGQDFGGSEFDYDDLFATGKALRVEAERFVAWCRHMGESIAAASWGQTQQEYARDWRLRHRALAAKFKSARPEFMEYIFAEPTADVTQQARDELGL